MQIKELAAATGVDVETIRYYEKQGLLPEPARLANGYRDYAPQHLERLSFIRHCRALDMPLADVARLLALTDDPQGHGGDIPADDLIANQLAKVRARLKSMHALEKQLVRLQASCDGHHEGGSCGILGELVAAAHSEARAGQPHPVTHSHK